MYDAINRTALYKTHIKALKCFAQQIRCLGIWYFVLDCCLHLWLKPVCKSPLCRNDAIGVLNLLHSLLIWLENMMEQPNNCFHSIFDPPQLYPTLQCYLGWSINNGQVRPARESKNRIAFILQKLQQQSFTTRFPPTSPFLHHWFHLSKHLSSVLLSKHQLSSPPPPPSSWSSSSSPPPSRSSSPRTLLWLSDLCYLGNGKRWNRWLF